MYFTTWEVHPIFYNNCKWSVTLKIVKKKFKKILVFYSIAIENTIAILNNANNYFKQFSSKKLNYSQRYSLVHISKRLHL